MKIYCEMTRIKERLSEDPNTRDRYIRATNGGKEWMAFSAWIAEDESRWSDEGVAAYRDALAKGLILTDIAYVLQFETSPEVVAFLKRQLGETAERETTPERLRSKKMWLGWGLHNKLDRFSGLTLYQRSRQAAAFGSLGANMERSAMREVAAYLQGCSQGSSYWAHPDYRRYLAWYNPRDRFETQNLTQGVEKCACCCGCGHENVGFVAR